MLKNNKNQYQSSYIIKIKIKNDTQIKQNQITKTQNEVKQQAREVLVMFVYRESTFPQHGKCSCRACLSLGGERTGGDRDRRSLRRERGTGQSNQASSLALLLLLCLT